MMMIFKTLMMPCINPVSIEIDHATCSWWVCFRRPARRTSVSYYCYFCFVVLIDCLID